MALNGLLAFIQNLSSFHTNKIAGALTLTICANMKQALSTLLALRIFHTKLDCFGIIGMAVVLICGALHSFSEIKAPENKRLPRRVETTKVEQT